MKRCPKCNFSFADSYHTCDFDGADLVDDPETLQASPLLTAQRPLLTAQFLRMIKSPVFLIVLLLAGVFSSLLLMVYYDAARQPNSIAESKPPQDSVASQAHPGPNEVSTGSGSDRLTSRSKIIKPEAAKDLSSTRERSVIVSRSRTRLRTSSIRNKQSRPEIALQRQPKDKALQKKSKERALQRDSKENANRKESKLTAALKTTWNILKKPFKF